MIKKEAVKDAIFLFGCFLLFLFVFRSIAFNLSTNLLDWFDYPYIVWVVSHNVEAFRSLRIDGFFDSNIFYPNKGTFLFSDMLMLPSFILFVLSYLTNNLINSFNLLFFISLVLNCVASLFFWKRFFQKRIYVYFATFLTAFSPYLFLSTSHFQLLSFWPFLFGLSFLFDKKITFRKMFFVGVLTGLQFITGVYLSIFMLFAIFIWFVLKLLYERTEEKLVRLRLIQVLIFGIAFLITAGFFASRYIQVKNAYNIKRDYGEYVLYSAHLTDYIFTSHYRSLLSTSATGEGWNRFNKHLVGESAGFPGVVILTLSFIGILGFKKDKKRLNLFFDLEFIKVYFLVLIISAFIFSLGPRLSVNGFYTGIPLPYHFVMKLVPIVEPVRAPARWMILLFLGLIYFAVVGLKKLMDRFPDNKLILVGIGVLFFVEIVPINKSTEAKNYYPKAYETIANKCQVKSSVLLEYPMTQFKKDANLLDNLSYRTQMMMASVRHRCDLVNGYHGYIPKDYEKYENELFAAIESEDESSFWEKIKEKNVRLVKLNENEIYLDRAERIKLWLLKKGKILYQDESFLVIEI